MVLSSLADLSYSMFSVTLIAKRMVADVNQESSSAASAMGLIINGNGCPLARAILSQRSITAAGTFRLTGAIATDCRVLIKDDD